MSMTVEQVREARQKAEREIFDILRGLENETGISVREVQIAGVSMSWMEEDWRRVITEVSVRLDPI